MRSEALHATTLPATRIATTRHRQRGPWIALVSEILRLAGPHADFQHHAERLWSSATFSGSRHTVSLEFRGASGLEAAEALIATLPDHEFTIPGQLVADATIAAVDHNIAGDQRMTVEIELLLLDES